MSVWIAFAVTLLVTVGLVVRDPLVRGRRDLQGTAVAGCAMMAGSALLVHVVEGDGSASPATLFCGLNVLMWLASWGRPVLIMSDLLTDEPAFTQGLQRRSRRCQWVLVAGIVLGVILLTDS